MLLLKRLSNAIEIIFQHLNKMLYKYIAVCIPIATEIQHLCLVFVLSIMK